MEFKSARSSRARNAVMYIFFCVFLAAYITLSVFLGLYAFNNPDAQAYYISGTDTSQADLVPIIPANDADGVVPIHDHFVTWFTWMFINKIVLLCFPCIACLLYTICLNKKRGLICNQLFLISYCCSSLVALVMGLIWRFGEAGRFASGDYLDKDAAVAAGPLYQVSSGKFILVKIILSVVWKVGGVCCLLFMYWYVEKKEKEIRERNLSYQLG